MISWAAWVVEAQRDWQGQPALELWWHILSATGATLCGIATLPTDRRVMRFAGPRAPGTSCGFCEAVYNGNPTR